MNSSILEAAVANHPFVQGMSAEHLRILVECAMFTQFEAGQIVFHAGEIANRFYLIQQGKVSLETRAANNELIVVQVLGAGDALGWSWLFAPFYWHFSACAMETTRAIFFYGTRLRARCEEDHEFGYELMKRVAAVLMERVQVTVREAVRSSKTGI